MSGHRNTACLRLLRSRYCMDTCAKAMPAVPGLWAPVPQTLNFTSRSVPHKELPQNRRTACGVIFSLCLLVLPAESTKRPTLLTERLHRSALAATVGQEPTRLDDATVGTKTSHNMQDNSGFTG